MKRLDRVLKGGLAVTRSPPLLIMVNNSTDFTNQQNPESFLGPIELGVLSTSVLYGIALVQTYKYFQASFRNDSVLLKCTVSF